MRSTCQGKAPGVVSLPWTIFVRASEESISTSLLPHEIGKTPGWNRLGSSLPRVCCCITTIQYVKLLVLVLSLKCSYIVLQNRRSIAHQRLQNENSRVDQTVVFYTSAVFSLTHHSRDHRAKWDPLLNLIKRS